MTEQVLQREPLENGLELVFIDQSNRYFGDFYQIKIQVVCGCVLTAELLARAGLDSLAQRRLQDACGDRLEYSRTLTRMGVAGPETTAVKAAMVADFIANSRSYLAAEDFPLALLRSKSNAPLTGRRYYDPHAN